MNIRTDLIEKALHINRTEDLTFRRLKPSNKFIDWLFRHYFVREFTEHFYDSEPDYDEEEFNMYMDYLYIHEQIEPFGTSFFNTILNLKKSRKRKRILGILKSRTLLKNWRWLIRCSSPL